jgi:hypothetical protein
MSSQGIRSSHPYRNGGESQAYDIAQLLFGQALKVEGTLGDNLSLPTGNHVIPSIRP